MLDRLTDEARTRLGWAEASFRCCDTDFEIRARGPSAERGVAEARRTAESLESQLNAFADDSAVARLNRERSVTNRHVAALVERGLEYADRTGGIFDVRRGEVERELKAYVRGETESPSVEFGGGSVSSDRDSGVFDSVTVEGKTVRTDVTLDLNGLAKGYIVDLAADALTESGWTGFGRTGFVNGGGDISRPIGPVGVESPFGDAKPLRVLDTDWNIASSAGYERRRGDVSHLYNPVTEETDTPHDIVTVVAKRDCMEADALATTLAVLPVDEAMTLAEEWDGAEALVVHQGVFHRTEGFTNHVYDA
jgi:thiamine biosynthesis lipoprotein